MLERRLKELGLVLPEPPRMPGRHARTAIGVAALPLNLPVVVAAELQCRTP
jgi:hypothetical protein